MLQIARTLPNSGWNPGMPSPVEICAEITGDLDLNPCSAEDFGMEDKGKPQSPSVERNRIPESGEDQAVSELTCSDAEDANITHMKKFGRLGERIDWACAHDRIADRSQRELARVIGVGETTLIAWREPAYGERGMRKWEPLKRLALETGWSYQWLRNGGSDAAPLSEDEERTLREDLEGPAAAPEQTASPQAAVAEKIDWPTLQAAAGLAREYYGRVGDKANAMYWYELGAKWFYPRIFGKALTPELSQRLIAELVEMRELIGK